MFKDIALTSSKKVAKLVLKTKMNSPHLFFGAGLIGVMGSTYLACRATLKLEATVDEVKKDIDGIKVTTQLTDTEKGRELAKVYVRGSVEVMKLYGPAVIVGTASLTALTGSHVQLTRRNAALSATLGLVSQAFEEYRQRVRDEIGEKKEYNLYRGITSQTIDEDGKKKVVKVIDPKAGSPYAVIFDEYNTNWQPNTEHNYAFLTHQQNWANERLKAKGYLFLNEVYKDLGFIQTKPGSVVGWWIGEDGDNYVDFGILDDPQLIVNAVNGGVMLDFNVDGVINTKLPERSSSDWTPWNGIAIGRGIH